MAEQSVGQISLDLVLNSKQFKNQLQNSVNSAVSSASKSCAGSVSSLFGKLGAIGAAAFSAKMLIDFGKSALELGSDLAEVQNVVDVAFEDMAGEADEFAKNALKNFGLSETSAKRYMGTFGAMASSFGYNTREAEKMAETLTGLTGDVASFYNLDSSVAYTKLKSVFTGETESLKELGVVMTQSALDQFALENGYGKTTKAMTEQEKVALRLAFVTSNLDKASGDFIRTQDSWANQTRILAESWNAFKAQIGQALIQVLTPMIKFINIIMAKLIQLASLLNKFTGKLFGKQDVKAASGVSTAIGGISDAAGTAADNTEKIGGAAKKAAKEIKKSLAGFDEITTLQDNSDSSSGGGAGVGGVGGGLNMPDLAETNEQLAETEGEVSALQKRLNELFENFKKGFDDAFDSSKIEKVKQDAAGLGEAFRNIITDEKVQESANNFLDKFSESLGKQAGSVASIGISLADGIVGSLGEALTQSGGFISERLASMFDSAGRIEETLGNLSEAVATVFEAFESDEFKAFAADIESLIIEPLSGAIDILLQFKADVVDALAKPFIDNAEKIKKTLVDLFAVVDPPLETLRQLFEETFSKFMDMYNEHIKPLIDDVGIRLSDFMSLCLDKFNQYVKPLLEYISNDVVNIIKENVGPLLDEAIKIIGNVADILKVLFDKLMDFFSWFIDKIVPILIPVIRSIWDVASQVIKSIIDIITDVMKVINGIIEFLVGVFTGDWEKAWQGIKDIFGGIWNAMVDISTLITETLKKIIMAFVEAIAAVILAFWEGLKKSAEEKKQKTEAFFRNIAETLVNGINSFIDNIKKKIAEFIVHIKAEIGHFIKEAKEKKEAIKTAFNEFIQNIKDKIQEFIDNFKEKLEEIKQKFDEFKQNLINKAKEIGKGVKDALINAFNEMKEKVQSIFDNLWNGIKKTINGLLSGIETMCNGLVNGINKAIEAINGLKIKIPRWVPIYGGDEFSPNLRSISSYVRIPKLAEGGYVAANTPQLAMIGDNRYEGEIVAPESKITEAVTKGMTPIIDGLKEVAGALIGNQNSQNIQVTCPVYLDGKMLETFVVNSNDLHNIRSGGYR